MATPTRRPERPQGKCEQCDNAVATILLATAVTATHFGRFDGRGAVTISSGQKQALCYLCCPPNLKPALPPDGTSPTTTKGEK